VKQERGPRASADQEERRAYKGQLRIKPIICTTPSASGAIAEQPLTLPILSTPNHQQARFYLAKDNIGTPLAPNDDERTDGYFKQDKQTNWRLRGRKVHPHHLDFKLRTDISNDGGQNRSFKAHVPKDTTFETTIEVTNLNASELGALLWLLSRPKNEFFRLAYAKPVGFGSVHIKILGTQLQTGQAIRGSYLELKPREKAACRAMDTSLMVTLIKSFMAEVAQSYGASFEDVSFIRAWTKAAKGQERLRYPRVKDQPKWGGEGFKWFVANSKANGEAKQSLPSLAEKTVRPMKRHKG
jgi:hypothetical protein